MTDRFSLYLRMKDMTQKKLSELSCVPLSTVNRFCNGGVISSDKLLRMLQVCDDLSLEWLFFNTGEMVRSRDGTVVNVGSFAGAEIAGGDAIVAKGANQAVKPSSLPADVERMLREKDEVIAERDRTILEKDGMILKLNEMLFTVYKGGR